MFSLFVYTELCNLNHRAISLFTKLMMAGDYATAMDIAKKQVEDGAHVIDINVDDGLLDGLAAMQKFVKIAVTEPEVAKVPFMLDASKFEIVLAGEALDFSCASSVLYVSRFCSSNHTPSFPMPRKV